MTIFVSMVVSLIATLVGLELFGWTSVVARRLLERAAKHLPVEHRDRYRSEWLAEYEILRDAGPLTKLQFAITVYLGSGATGRAAAEIPPIPAGHDLIWGTPDDAIQRMAYEQALRELAVGNLNVTEDAEEKRYRLCYVRRVHLPENVWGKHGDIEIRPHAWIDVAPLTFNCLVMIWKRVLLRDDCDT